MTSLTASATIETMWMVTPNASRLTSPAEASAVPRAMNMTERVRGREGRASRAANRASIVTRGVRDCRQRAGVGRAGGRAGVDRVRQGGPFLPSWTTCPVLATLSICMNATVR